MDRRERPEEEDEDDDEDEEDRHPRINSIGMLAQMTAPLIAITLPEPFSRSQTPEPSMMAAAVAGRRRMEGGGGGGGGLGARSRPLLNMRRCKSATTTEGGGIVIGSEDSVVQVSSSPARTGSLYGSRLRIPHHASLSLAAAWRASQRAFSLRDGRAREAGRRRSEAAIAKRSSYIVVAFLVMWLPLPVAVGIGWRHFAYSSSSSLPEVQWYLDLQLSAYSFGMMTAVSNPIIYALAIRSFRAAFKRLSRRAWNEIKNRSPRCLICR